MCMLVRVSEFCPAVAPATRFTRLKAMANNGDGPPADLGHILA